MKLNRHNIHKALLASLNDPTLRLNFDSKIEREMANYGYIAVSKSNSNVSMMLMGFSKALEQEFSKYDLIEEKLNLANYASYEELINSPTGPQLLAKFDQERIIYNQKKLNEDKKRQEELEASWKTEESLSRDAKDEKERLELAERCAQNIFNGNIKLKG